MSNEPDACTVVGTLSRTLLRETVVRDLSSGTYRIEYNDRTHLEAQDWRSIVEIEVQSKAPTPGLLRSNEHPFYVIAPPSRAVPMAATKTQDTSVRSGGARRSSDVDSAQRDDSKLRDVLGQCLLRTSVLPAIAEPETFRDLERLSHQKALVVIPDTNSLSNGVLHYLLQALARTQIWVMPVAVSLTTLQQKDAALKSLLSETKPSHLRSALRSRSLVNASLALLQRCRAHAQVIEVDPQLLRYMRPASDKASDPDRADVLEDRLLVESIHAALRSMRTRATQRVVTSDVFLARVLHAEGIRTLTLQAPRFPEQPTPCLRYDPLARAFRGATLPEFLWDLTHTFASVRLVDPSEPKRPLLRLDAYWDGKTARDWRRQVLRVRLLRPRSTASRPLSSAPLPEAPFLDILRLGGALLRGTGSVEILRERIEEQTRPSEEIAKHACEVLRRAGFASLTEGNLTGTEHLSTLNERIASGDLDGASALWRERYSPYRALVELLQAEGSVKFADLPAVLAEVTAGEPGRRACEHLARAVVRLGQAWSSEDKILDGSQRPDDEKFVATIMQLVRKHARDGLVSYSILLPRLCEELRMSPWAAGMQLQRLAKEGALPELTFSGSLGTVGRAHPAVPIVAGSLADIREVPIPLDRLKYGPRLVYTLSWKPS